MRSTGIVFVLFVLALFAHPDSAATQTIFVSNASVMEGNSGTTPLVFNVFLSPVQPYDVSVDFATADGTAVAGIDYVGASGTVIFVPGQTNASIVVDVLGDLDYEGTENFYLNLSNPVGATIGDPTATGTIYNDDGTLAILNAAGYEGDTGSTALVFTVALSLPVTQYVTVDFATADGSAIAGSDFLDQTGTVTIPPGQTTTTITIDIVGDDDPEPAENFYVNLSNPVGAELWDASAIGTIYNDDAYLSIANASVIEGDTGSTEIMFRLSLSLAESHDVTVDWATADQTATAGVDYVANSGTVTIPQGETSVTIPVDVIGDTVEESHETFSVVLSNPIRCSIADGFAVGTIFDNDGAVAVIPVTWGAVKMKYRE